MMMVTTRPPLKLRFAASLLTMSAVMGCSQDSETPSSVEIEAEESYVELSFECDSEDCPEIEASIFDYMIESADFNRVGGAQAADAGAGVLHIQVYADCVEARSVVADIALNATPEASWSTTCISEEEFGVIRIWHEQ